MAESFSFEKTVSSESPTSERWAMPLAIEFSEEQLARDPDAQAQIDSILGLINLNQKISVNGKTGEFGGLIRYTEEENEADLEDTEGYHYRVLLNNGSQTEFIPIPDSQFKLDSLPTNNAIRNHLVMVLGGLQQAVARLGYSYDRTPQNTPELKRVLELDEKFDHLKDLVRDNSQEGKQKMLWYTRELHRAAGDIGRMARNCMDTAEWDRLYRMLHTYIK